MIEINLLPGTKKKSRRGGGGGGGGGGSSLSMPKVDFAAWIESMRERIREPWLIGAVVVSAITIGGMGALYVRQAARESSLEQALQKAVQDSTRFASVLREREMAEAKRDTVLRSLNLIRAIDDDRFIWPHVMDEVSRALPPYTWIVSLGFTGAGQAQLNQSTRATDNGKEVTQFQLDMLYSRPEAELVRRVPLAVSVR